MRIFVILILLSVIPVAISCSTPGEISPIASTPGVETPQPKTMLDWEIEWNKALGNARAENRLTISTFMGSELRSALFSAFKEKYGISPEFIAASGGETVQRVSAERRAGIYLPDLIITGSNTIFSSLKPSGFIDPIDTALILPEVKNPEMWWAKKLPFLDKEGRFVFSYGASVNQWSALINSSLVKEADISYKDLLSPRWKGQIIINDPTFAGRGLKWFSVAMVTNALDRSYFEEFVKQEPVVTRDLRMPAEWVAMGKKLLAIAPTPDPIRQFQRAGAEIKEISIREDKPYFTSTGSANIVLMNKAPHTDAAKVFINWLLSKEGQTIWSRSYLYASLRLDTPTDHLRRGDIPEKNMQYFIADGPDFLEKQEEYQKLAREIFGPFLAR